MMPKLISFDPPILECGHKLYIKKRSNVTLGKEYRCNPCDYKGQGIRSVNSGISLGQKPRTEKRE